MLTSRLWLVFAVVTTIAWGLWGAFINKPADNGFPETLGYVAWSFTMIPPAIVALILARWKLDCDPRSIVLGVSIGLLGAGGQLLLFQTVPSMAPGYLVFPFIALSPLVTILLAALISREKVRLPGWIGIALATVAGVLLNLGEADSQHSTQATWILFALGVLLAWGIQGYVISFANNSMRAESIFFYMALTGLALAPVAWWMTDAPRQANWHFDGFGLSCVIQLLNSLGALLLVYAYRYGKAIVVSPLINAGAPVITALLTMLLLGTSPSSAGAIGILLAILAAGLMAIEEDPPQPSTEMNGT
ncbi:DMT family transporter [Aeoliella mucimassa]|nr:DMT family transporter [Aeoliella mucimassa]